VWLTAERLRKKSAEVLGRVVQAAKLKVSLKKTTPTHSSLRWTRPIGTSPLEERKSGAPARAPLMELSPGLSSGSGLFLPGEPASALSEDFVPSRHHNPRCNWSRRDAAGFESVAPRAIG
jgi:hypothetical protein